MIFSVGPEVLRQMLDPAGQKCDLHIRAAGIFVMQLELLETQRLVALCHNEGATLGEEPILATAQRSQAAQETISSLSVWDFRGASPLIRRGRLRVSVRSINASHSGPSRQSSRPSLS